MEWRRYVAPGVLLAGSAGVYWPATRTFFVGDDFWWLHYASTAMGHPSGWLPVFTQANGMGTYRPLTENVYFWLCWHLFGAAPLGFHLIAMAVFLATVYAVWRLSERMAADPWVAAGAAALFAGCTALYEALDWAAAFSEVGAVACMAFGTLAWASGHRRTATLWCVAGLFCDETAVSLPCMLALFCFLAAPLPLWAAVRRALRETWGALAVLAAYLVARVGFIGLHAAGAFAPVWSAKTWAELAWRSLLWSLDISGVLRNVAATWRPEVVVVLSLVALSGVGIAGVAVRRLDPAGMLLVATGVGWWGLGLLPVLPIAHDFSAYNLGGALLGVPLVVVGLLRSSRSASRALASVLGGAFLVLGAMTVYGPGGLSAVDGVSVLSRQAQAAWTQFAAAYETTGPGSFCAPASASWTLGGQWEAALVDPGGRVQYGQCAKGDRALRLTPSP